MPIPEPPQVAWATRTAEGSCSQCQTHLHSIVMSISLKTVAFRLCPDCAGKLLRLMYNSHAALGIQFDTKITASAVFVEAPTVLLPNYTPNETHTYLSTPADSPNVPDSDKWG